MRLSAGHLAKFTKIPENSRELRLLLDDVGIEVKRVEQEGADTHFTVELLANRGDHYCYEGIAREVSGRTGEAVDSTRRAPLVVGDSPIPLVVQTDDVLVYTATLMVKDGEEKQLPPHLINALNAAGIHSISPPVDATNLSNMELGQPTHAFDADTIVGPITIRHSVDGEKAWLLFTEAPVVLPTGTLVIADDEKVLAVAGVIGCEESKTTDATRRLLIESATFDPVKVRKASRALDTHTDSSARFERGADPTYPLVGAGRVAFLLQEYGGWSISGTTGIVGSWEDPARQILLSVPAAASFLEYPLTAEEAQQRLTRYGFTVSKSYPDWTHEAQWDPSGELRDTSKERLKNSVVVQVPPHRLWDVEFAADLYEELAKSIGYNNTPERLPQIDMGVLPTPAQKVQAKTGEVLRGYGFFEVFTDGFYGRDVRTKLNLDKTHPLWHHVETQNAMEKGYSLLKNNNVAQALDAVAINMSRRNFEIKAYEFTRTFHLDPKASNGVCSEANTLWAVASGDDRNAKWSKSSRQADAFFLKGMLAELGLELNLDISLTRGSASTPMDTLMHPNRFAHVQLDGEIIGILGEIHPAIVQNWKIKRLNPCFLQLDMDALIAASPEKPAYVAPGTFHPIDRSLAFTLGGQIESGTIADYLQSTGPEWLKSVGMADLYEHEEDGRSVRTITYSLRFISGGENRSAEEVNTACEYLIKAVQERFGDQGVKLRA